MFVIWQAVEQLCLQHLRLVWSCWAVFPSCRNRCFLPSLRPKQGLFPPCPRSCSKLRYCYFFLIHIWSQIENYVEKHRVCCFYVWIYNWEQKPAWQPFWLPLHTWVDQCRSLCTTSAMTWADLTWSERVSQFTFSPFGGRCSNVWGCQVPSVQCCPLGGPLGRGLRLPTTCQHQLVKTFSYQDFQLSEILLSLRATLSFSLLFAHRV